MSPLTNSDTNAYNQEATESTTAGTISSSHPVDGLEFTTHLPAGEIHRRALLARKLQGKTHHLLAQLLLEMEERKLYREFGCSSVYMYAGLHLHLEGHTVAEYLRTGRSLRAFPLLAEAYREGAISACKVREITRVAKKETEPYWLEIARTHTYRQIEKMVVFSPRRNNPPAREEQHQFRDMVTTHLLTQSSPESRNNLPSCPADTAASSRGALQPLLPGFDGDMCGQGPPDPTAGSHHPLQCQAADGDIPDRNHTGPISCSYEGEVTPPLQGPSPQETRSYLEKMVLELSAEQAAIIHEALTRASKESGMKDRASLFSHIARRFLDNGHGSPGEVSKKPPYQVVIHHHPGSQVTWTESARGPVYMPSAAFNRVLCDAEMVDMHAMGENEQGEPGSLHEVASAGSEELGKYEGAGGYGQREPDTPIEHVNRLYQAYRDRGRARKRNAAAKSGRGGMSPEVKQGERTGKQERTGTIPPALRKKVLLRDGGRCQVPGCGRSHHVEVHHLMPLGAGGDHVLEGLLALCSGCHRNVHEGRLSIEGTLPGRLIFRRASKKSCTL